MKTECSFDNAGVIVEFEIETIEGERIEEKLLNGEYDYYNLIQNVYQRTDTGFVQTLKFNTVSSDDLDEMIDALKILRNFLITKENESK